MKKVILICGKICSGKTYYAKELKEKYNAVILSTDEVTYELIQNEQGEFYNIFAARVNQYLRKKSIEIVRAGANVILDWGFWTRQNRTEISAFLASNDVSYEWHYMDINDKLWRENIEERNHRILEGNGGSDFFVDEGLLNKMLSMFEEPREEEMDIWHRIQKSSLRKEKT
ncbi:MAG: ATP-binding protein [Roseburia sp.]|nr:ATP-binding protein [Roseburia sp.]